MYLKVCVINSFADFLVYQYQELSTENLENIIGKRVSLMLNNKQMVGIVFAIYKDYETLLQQSQGKFMVPKNNKIKEINSILDDVPLMQKNDLSFYQFAAQYYCATLGYAIGFAIPKLLKEPKPLEKILFQLELDKKRRKKQILKKKIFSMNNLVFSAQFLEYIHKGTWYQKDTLRKYGMNKRGVKFLILQKLVKQYQSNVEFSLSNLDNVFAKEKLENAIWNFYQNSLLDYCENATDDSLVSLNFEQSKVIDKVCNYLNKYQTFLLHGETASGKTEVYIDIITNVVANGKQAIFLVPEIGLTKQTMERLQSRLQKRIYTKFKENHNGKQNIKIMQTHSKLTDSERAFSWLQMKNQHAQVLLGTRSALFTTVPNLGVIIVDEEHDSSYKQEGHFSYSARDMAIYKASKLKIPIVLGSATPSLESYYNSIQGRYILLHLPKINQYRKTVKLVNQVNNKTIFNELILQRIEQVITTGKQVLIFLNRRGYARVLYCIDCNTSIRCNNCSLNMVYYHKQRQLRCNLCGAKQVVSNTCPNCNSKHMMEFVGIGTEQVMAELEKFFPSVAKIQLDTDTISSVSNFNKSLEKINNNKYKIVVGTQLISKGHHFANMNAVIILGLDNYLFSTDFRAHEKLAQLYYQLEGRVGRVGNGEIFLVTQEINNSVLQKIINTPYLKFIQQELQFRQEFSHPPYIKQVLLSAEHVQQQLALQYLQQLQKLLQRFVQNYQLPVLVLGVMPNIVEKINKKYRFEILLQTKYPQNMRQVLKYIKHLTRIANSSYYKSRKVDFKIDVDPLH